MNERVKELMAECYNPYGEFYYEKFAELIVAECADFVYNYPERYLTRNQAREISLSMEEHFGVKE